MNYTPDKGDILKLSFDPQSGHEQSGWRPGLVISNKTFNRATGFAVICPITNTNRNYPFHKKLPDSLHVSGVVMIEQAKSLDYRRRNAKYITSVPDSFIKDITALFEAVLQDD